MSRLSRVPSLLFAGVALLSIGAPLAHACSLVRPWEYRRAARIEFEATPIHDTVLAGAGDMQFVQAPGHFGPGTARAIYGQRVRVNRLTARARAALPEGVGEVLLVPWDYGADCRPVPWSRSAGWLPDTLTGVFAGTLRAREHWAGALPTLDITPFAQPYREPPADTTVRDWLPTRRLSIDRLLRLYDELWPLDTPLDTVTALAYAERLRADTSLAGRYPVSEYVHDALYTFNEARRRAVRSPVSGTFRLEVSLNDGPPRTMFLRTSATPTSLEYAPRVGGDTALAPPTPTSYSMHATTAVRPDDLAPSCGVDRRYTTAYMYVQWHGDPGAGGEHTWPADLDDRLFPSLLTPSEHAQWQADVQAANEAARAEWKRAWSAGERPPAPGPYVQRYRMRFTRDAAGPVRVEGTMDVPHIGTARLRGERVSDDVLACGW
jgi:hypothetical protein